MRGSCDAATCLACHSNVIHSVTFSPNGHVPACAGEDVATKIWDVATRRELRTLRIDANGINSVSFSPDGSTRATAGYDSTIVLWDVSTVRELHVPTSSDGSCERHTEAQRPTRPPPGASYGLIHRLCSLRRMSDWAVGVRPMSS